MFVLMFLIFFFKNDSKFVLLSMVLVCWNKNVLFAFSSFFVIN